MVSMSLIVLKHKYILFELTTSTFFIILDGFILKSFTISNQYLFLLCNALKIIAINIFYVKQSTNQLSFVENVYFLFRSEVQRPLKQTNKYCS